MDLKLPAFPQAASLIAAAAGIEPAQQTRLNDQIAATEARFGTELPDVLKTFHAIFGDAELVMRGHDRMTPVLALELSDGGLTVCDERDGRMSWVLRESDLCEVDPPVWQRQPETQQWFELGAPLSTFLLTEAAWQLVNTLPTRAACKFDLGAPRKLKQGMVRVAKSMGYPNSVYVDPDKGVVALVLNDAERIHVAARDAAGVARVEELTGLKFTPWTGPEVPKKVLTTFKVTQKELKSLPSLEASLQSLTAALTKPVPGQALGCERAELADADKQLGVALPTPLKTFYATVGRVDAVMKGVERVCAPRELKLEAGCLKIGEEQQELWHWVIREGDLGMPDPPVWRREPGGTAVGEQEPTLSTFLVWMATWQVINSLPSMAQRDLGRGVATKIKKHMSLLAFEKDSRRAALLAPDVPVAAVLDLAEGHAYFGAHDDGALETWRKRAKIELNAL